MERLKSLSSEVIQKYIRDNQQYYVNYKKEIESKSPVIISFAEMSVASTCTWNTRNISPSQDVVPLPGKKRKKYDEMRESFKCNPFNSDQQLAMYYTLREIFEVPKTHFVVSVRAFLISYFRRIKSTIPRTLSGMSESAHCSPARNIVPALRRDIPHQSFICSSTDQKTIPEPCVSCLIFDFNSIPVREHIIVDWYVCIRMCS